jgi:hypothetical protein
MKFVIQREGIPDARLIVAQLNFSDETGKWQAAQHPNIADLAGCLDLATPDRQRHGQGFGRNIHLGGGLFSQQLAQVGPVTGKLGVMRLQTLSGGMCVSAKFLC